MLDSDGQSLEQVCRLTNVIGCRTQSHKKSDEEEEIEPRVSSTTGWKRKLWERLAYLASFCEVASYYYQ